MLSLGCTISTLSQTRRESCISVQTMLITQKETLGFQLQAVVNCCLDKCDTLAKMSHSSVSEIWQRVQTWQTYTQSEGGRERGGEGEGERERDRQRQRQTEREHEERKTTKRQRQKERLRVCVQVGEKIRKRGMDGWMDGWMEKKHGS